jgi:CheY-like chemotaxis protein
MLTYLIDDEPISLFLTEQVLRQEGATSPIRPFARAEAGLQFLVSHLSTEVPNVILLDLNMPVVNGWDFLEALAPYAAVQGGGGRIYTLTSSLALAATDRAKVFPMARGVIHKPFKVQVGVPRLF